MDDLAYQAPDLAGFTEDPDNDNGRQTLMCVTDRVPCCDNEGLGNWYYPDGTTVIGGGGSATFRTNRGQNGNGEPGSVRLWRKYTPPERGLFHCELPDAANTIHTLYVNICKFPMMSLLVHTANSILKYGFHSVFYPHR